MSIPSYGKGAKGFGKPKLLVFQKEEMDSEKSYERSPENVPYVFNDYCHFTCKELEDTIPLRKIEGKSTKQSQTTEKLPGGQQNRITHSNPR